MTTIRFLDLARLHRSLGTELDEAFQRTIAASDFVGGGATATFEEEFASAHACGHVVGCGSGTDALTFALSALGVGAGDEVIVPAMTFVATAEGVIHAGATPVLADVDDHELLLSAASVRSLRTARTKAVIPVHLYGNMTPPALMQGWRDEGLVVIEDAAQAHLATRDGHGVGRIGDAACFSFYPGKNLGALGDAGAIAVDDAAIAARLRRLRDHGSAGKYEHSEIGYCSRLDGLQAALLSVKLRHLAAWTDTRRRLAEYYALRLDEHGIDRVAWDPGSVHHLMVVRVAAGDRDRIRRSLAARGIETAVHYPRSLAEQPALSRWHRPCPVATRAATEVLSLPFDPLMEPHEVDTVCDAVAAEMRRSS